MRSIRNERGSIMVTILVIMIFMTSLLFSLIILSNANLHRARGRIQLLQAQYSAESGADAAIAILNSGNTTYAGSGGEVAVLSTGQWRSTFSTTVANGADAKERVITATGYIYSPASSTTPDYSRTIRVTAQRSSTTTASSIVSRNIIDIASGVKNLYARDIYANGYINMSKNTTYLVAENVTIAGKNTGSGNCSIGGTGNLLKPVSFTDPAQTKTRLTLAFNNCINPPGNASNADFDVLVNNTNVTAIQSTYIPWSQYMDGSYQDSPGGCSDWTTGASPRNIPSTGNTKKTHYPDSANNVAASCGTGGSLDLGSNQYNIQDNVHIRANLCASSGCDPTFNNPTSDVVYVFIEGSINFTSVKTVAGSGPMVFIAYGADPASKAADCPLGGAIYLGQQGSSNTEAPAIYFLAMNGLCIDKTKFDNEPALGGIGGKNIYVASNPATPRDLRLDPSFPVDEIPIDLSWRQVGYERL
jgi:hypothetical protein